MDKLDRIDKKRDEKEVDPAIIQEEICKASPQHETFFKAFSAGNHVFLTGGAGTGKTSLVRKLKEYCELTNFYYIVASTTGVSALLLEGRTLHSLFRFPIKNYVVADICRDYQGKLQKWHGLSTPVEKRSDWIANIRNANLLIIDEISMCSAWLFNMINYACQILRERTELFGGLQLICVGDFLQLPPVYDTKQKPTPDPRCGLYAFESPLWAELKIETHKLVKCFRQKDETFAGIVRKIGHGLTLTPDENRLVESRRNLTFDEKDRIIYLMHENRLAREKNVACYENLLRQGCKQEEYKFPLDECKIGAHLEDFEHLLKDVRDLTTTDSDKQMFAIGARVMHLANNEELGLCNGDLGVVVDFKKMPHDAKVTKDVYFDGDEKDVDEDKLFPVVKFDDGVTHTITDYVWKRTRLINHGAGTHIEAKIVAAVSAIPLKLAWASTINKIQGTTISRACKVDISLTNLDRFSGLLYVAVSRCQTFDQFTLRGHEKIRPRVDSRAVKFYSEGKTEAVAVSRMEEEIKAVRDMIASPLKLKDHVEEKHDTQSKMSALLRKMEEYDYSLEPGIVDLENFAANLLVPFLNINAEYFCEIKHRGKRKMGLDPILDDYVLSRKKRKETVSSFVE